jgi:hypothetical protein
MEQGFQTWMVVVFSAILQDKNSTLQLLPKPTAPSSGVLRITFLLSINRN